MTAAKTLSLRVRNKLRTRAEIHDSALEVFHEDGFSESSIEKIAPRAEACMKIADRMAAEELTQLITREQGKPLNGLGSR